MFFITDVLTKFAKFTGHHMCWSLHFNKAAALRTAGLYGTLIRVFPINFEKFLRSPFLSLICVI